MKRLRANDGAYISANTRYVTPALSVVVVS